MNGIAIPAEAAEGAPPLLRAASKRRPELELARIACCVFIIFIHVAPIHRMHPFGNFLFIAAKCCATQVFFLIMGAFLSARSSFRAQVARLLTKHAIPFLAVTLAIIQLWPGISRQTPLRECFTRLNVDFRGFAAMLLALDEKAYFNSMGYEHYSWVLGILWFMFALYKCYLFFPVLKPLCVDGPAEAWVKRYALVLGGLLTVVAPSLKLLAPDSVFASMPSLPESPFLHLWAMLAGNHLYAALSDPDFGESLRRRARIFAPIIFLLCVSGIHLLTHAFDVDEKGIQGIFLERGFVLLVAANVAAFAFFSSIRISDARTADAICAIAGNVFYVYLVHMAVNQVVIHWVCAYELAHPILPRFAVTASVAVTAYALACLLRRIEGGVKSAGRRIGGAIRGR